MIDKLWIDYSNGKFGFSVQKQIYQTLGDTKKVNQQVWIAFADKVGWCKDRKWLNWWERGFHNSGPYAHGYFPSLTPTDRTGVRYNFIPRSPRADTCGI